MVGPSDSCVYDERRQLSPSRRERSRRACAGARELGRSRAHSRGDEDVLDTWFSPRCCAHSTLGWPGETRSLRTVFLPSSVLVTGLDVLWVKRVRIGLLGEFGGLGTNIPNFFWVAAHDLTTTYFKPPVPFLRRLHHARSRTRKDRRFDVEGNVLDPIDLIDASILKWLDTKSTTT